jgi:hypothetical protein
VKTSFVNLCDKKKNPSRGGEGFLGSKLSIRINNLKWLG